jgi:hypothetical protein
MRAFFDPATGKLREPTAAELQELDRQDKERKAQQKISIQPKEFTLPDGAVGVTVDPTEHASMQGCSQPDGTVKVDHQCDRPSAPK